MSTKTSAAQKANYARYATEGRAAANKKVKIARHMKKHPNDKQSAAQRPGSRAGMASTKGNALVNSIERALNHSRLFGQETVLKVSGRDLSSAGARAIAYAKAPAASHKAA